MAILRYATQSNATGAALTSALITKGEDYTFKSIKRILAAADVGNAAGQTQHANGCLVVQFSGAIIKDVVHFSVFRPGGGWNRIADNIYAAAAANVFNTGWAISADGASLLLRDQGTGAPGLLVAGDFIQALVVLGNV